MPGDNPLNGEQSLAGEASPEVREDGATASPPTSEVSTPAVEAFAWPALESRSGPAPQAEEVFATSSAEDEPAEPSRSPEPLAAAEPPAPAQRELPAPLRLIAAFGRTAPSGPTSVEDAGEDEGTDAASPAPRHEAEVGVRRRAQVAPALIALDRIDDDTTFQVRAAGDVSLLATDIARVGQLFPVDVRLQGPDRFQVVSGFRRVAALRFLQREFVLARVHTELGDEDALLMSLAAAIHAAPVDATELESTRERLAAEGRLFAAARDMLDKALQPDDEGAPDDDDESEVDADELAADVAARLGALNQDLALLADVFQSLDEGRRAELLMQLRYPAELVAYLESLPIPPRRA
ncbi:MAG: ParB N-terminal domain-containing protein [Myxococcaceae bacterium]|nr:ParB N-terminal domain-containing protein [Myxococcaceae bacterium]MCI0672704.1 ParB N-terminal domain-containing protein [Myxococcaceae bacterium]